MHVYLLQRFVTAFLTLVWMSAVIFVLLRLAPGNIVDILFASAGFVNPAAQARDRTRALSLDQPIPVPSDTGRWLKDIARGELGKSYRYDIPAWQVIKPRIPVTVELAILALLIAVLLGVPIGVLSAIRQDTVTDYLLRTVSLAGLSMPSFWLGMVIILLLVFISDGFLR